MLALIIAGCSNALNALWTLVDARCTPTERNGVSPETKAMTKPGES
jgi:hypothetical protein